eukprot:GHVT01070635.1.p1 GENE.GHVT01070635.1~~GHVT01070635.1.p1  ORF type:complete len:176 (+),score=25.17 GHVT01070635.1:135-662(+)
MNISLSLPWGLKVENNFLFPFIFRPKHFFLRLISIPISSFVFHFPFIFLAFCWNVEGTSNLYHSNSKHAPLSYSSLSFPTSSPSSSAISSINSFYFNVLPPRLVDSSSILYFNKRPSFGMSPSSSFPSCCFPLSFHFYDFPSSPFSPCSSSNLQASFYPNGNNWLTSLNVVGNKN